MGLFQPVLQMFTSLYLWHPRWTMCAPSRNGHSWCVLLCFICTGKLLLSVDPTNLSELIFAPEVSSHGCSLCVFLSVRRLPQLPVNTNTPESSQAESSNTKTLSAAHTYESPQLISAASSESVMLKRFEWRFEKYINSKRVILRLRVAKMRNCSENSYIFCFKTLFPTLFWFLCSIKKISCMFEICW